MRRDVLPPPIRLGEPLAEAAWPDRSIGGGATESRLPRHTLARPSRARERLRRLFDPARGWVRRSERALNHAISSRVFPRVPWLSGPYGRLLRRQLVLSEATVEIPGLPAAFDGATLLWISDVHAGPFLSEAALSEAFRRLQATAPDLILLGGDLATSHVEEVRAQRDAFRSLRAPLGVYAVMGNHDHYTGALDELIAVVEGFGIPVLHNRGLPIERAGERLWLAGVDDLLIGDPDLDRALDGADAPVVLMSHNPDLLFEAARRGVALMLSGHTHGGQIRLPGLPVLVRQSRYRLDEGRFRAGSCELIVSRGLGAVAVPWRSQCPPEAVRVTLRRERAVT